jgi:4-amino-4-deoxy-L-arabinose transferase-like glycosyltransferase
MIAPLRRVPRAAWGIALVAVISGVVWSLLIPPLQSFDEPVHVYYGQFLGETGNVPRPVAGSVLSDEEQAIVNATRLFDVVGNRDARPPWTQAEGDRLHAALESGLGRVSQGADGGVGSYPPLYYAAGAAAYRIMPGTLLDRMWAMRLVSALLAGVSILFVFAFLRELLPRSPWTWRIGALVAALQPLFGFLSGSFNPDMGLTAASAALFFLLARAFRRGLTVPIGIGLGLALSLGFLSKLSMTGFIPGAAVAGLLLARRTRSVRGLAAGVVAAAAPVLAYCIVNVTLWDRPLLPSATGASTGAAVRNTREMLVYVWQDYLPRLSFMQDTAPDFPLWHRYFRGWVGVFGWGDYGFATWVAWATLGLAAILAAAVIALALRHWADVRARWDEWLSYLVLWGGMLLLLGYTGYGYWKDTNGNGFEQGRYLLPFLALYAALVAVGVRGLGARWGRVAGVLLVCAALAQTIWAYVITIERFYG